ncbi:MAG TPA: mercuric transporter MerT family protein [Stellaceae bacterium]|nr:mercuric transporter MerT family protein [Stellaceae bacterium]
MLTMSEKAQNLLERARPGIEPSAATMRAAPDPQNDARPASTPRLLAAGGIMAALGAASCCVIPFALFTLGISGAWISNLTALEPYQPIFAAVALGFIGYGAYLVYWKPACADGSYCAKPASNRIAKIGLWSAGVLVVIAIGFPKLITLFL